jgi:putative nucleotidyltransferase with HDIG domain
MSACSSCGAHDDLSYARKVADGLRAVLAGRSERFQLEYPCDGPDQPRWFLLTLTPFPSDGPVRVVVAHENVTALKLAQRHALQQAERLLAAYGGTVRAVALAVEKRDPYTFGHQQQVAQLCEGIAVQLGLDAQRREGLRLGATIHDIGKIFVPAEILNRPGRLSAPEMQIIRTHPESGHELLKDIEFPWPIADMVRHHHELLDGSGYPDHLAGDALCLEVRILTVADVFDAITSHRPYRPAKPFAEGQRALTEGRGSWYDPLVVDALFAHLESARR